MNLLKYTESESRSVDRGSVANHTSSSRHYAMYAVKGRLNPKDDQLLVVGLTKERLGPNEINPSYPFK